MLWDLSWLDYWDRKTQPLWVTARPGLWCWTLRKIVSWVWASPSLLPDHRCNMTSCLRLLPCWFSCHNELWDKTDHFAPDAAFVIWFLIIATEKKPSLPVQRLHHTQDTSYTTKNRPKRNNLHCTCQQNRPTSTHEYVNYPLKGSWETGSGISR